MEVFNNGLVLQWGHTVGYTEITLPITFKYTPRMFGTPELWNTAAGETTVNIYRKSLSKITYQTRWKGTASEYSMDFFVIGG